MNMVLEQEVTEVFPNLRAELDKQNITDALLAVLLRCHPRDIRGKMKGEAEFTLSEILKIKKQLFPDLAVDYLFAEQTVSDETSKLLVDFVSITSTIGKKNSPSASNTEAIEG